MWGMLLGGITFGLLADKYGRKTTLMVGIVIQSFCSYVGSFIPCYWWFLFNWFILALATGGIGIISFVVCMEVSRYTSIQSQIVRVISTDFSS